MRESESDVGEAGAKRFRFDSPSSAATNPASTSPSFTAEQANDEAEELTDGGTGQANSFSDQTGLDDSSIAGGTEVVALEPADGDTSGDTGFTEITDRVLGRDAFNDLLGQDEDAEEDGDDDKEDAEMEDSD
jgi:hypothetical protein